MRDPADLGADFESWFNAALTVEERTAAAPTPPRCRRCGSGDVVMGDWVCGACAGTLADSTKGIWYEMIRRCSNPKDASYPNYGGRGVQVCDRWAGSFAAFVADVGQRPTWEHSLDRYPDPAGNYEPGNVRWATASEQNRNKRPRTLV